MRRGLSFGALALLLVACSDDKSAGGGGIEIPNGIEMAVVDSLGKPAVGVRVRVLAGDDWASLVASGASPVLDSTTTDAQGKAVIPSRDGNFWVEARSASGSARAASGDILSHLMLAAPASLNGRIPTTSPRPVRMRLAGTDLVAAVDASGSFTFHDVIRGGYALVAEGAKAGAGPLPAGSARVGYDGSAKLDVRIDTSGILLDDFSDGDVAWGLGDVFGPAWWWMNASEPRDSVFGVGGVEKTIRDSAGLRWMRVDVVKATSWANFGLDLGYPEHRLPSIAKISAIRMRARGTGSWNVKLSCYSDAKTETSSMSGVIVLDDSAWTDVRVPLSSFPSAIPLPNRLRNLVFWTDKPGTLEIDDVALEGVGLQDWLNP